MPKIHLPLKTDETNIYLPLNKMDDYFYMVTSKIKTFGLNICNYRLTPFMDNVYFLCLLLQKKIALHYTTEYQLHLSKFPM